MIRVFELYDQFEELQVKSRLISACVLLLQAWGEREIQILKYYGFGKKPGQRESLRPKLIRFLNESGFQDISAEIDKEIKTLLATINSVAKDASQCVLPKEKWIPPSQRNPEPELEESS